jgi:ketosteroid isomerase-like protein
MISKDEKEIRKLYEEWFKDSGKKDLKKVMEKIDDNAVSYEHDTPLQYVGTDAIREVCRKGFEAMKGELDWNIPDLKIIIKDDIAITWGLNHMQAQEPGKEMIDLWSRGTRIFQKINGKWKMIHQHVSFPYDPETGEVKMNLKPQ